LAQAIEAQAAATILLAVFALISLACNGVQVNNAVRDAAACQA